MKGIWTIFLMVPGSSSRINDWLINNQFSVGPGFINSPLLQGKITSAYCVSLSYEASYDEVKIMLGQALIVLEVPHYGFIFSSEDKTYVATGRMPEIKKVQKPQGKIIPFPIKKDDGIIDE